MFKIIIFGSSKTGKSSFFHTFAHKVFYLEHKATEHVEFASSEINIKGMKFNVQLWDTPSFENARKMSYAYLKLVHGVLLFYDVTSRESFFEMCKIFNDIRQKNQKVPIFILGNKSDLIEKRQVSQQEVLNFCLENDTAFLEVSVFKRINLNLALLSLIRSISNLNTNSNDDYSFPPEKINNLPRKEAISLIRNQLLYHKIPLLSA